MIVGLNHEYFDVFNILHGTQRDASVNRKLSVDARLAADLISNMDASIPSSIQLPLPDRLAQCSKHLSHH